MTEVFWAIMEKIESPSDFAVSRAQKYTHEDGYKSSLAAWTLLEKKLNERGIFPLPQDIQTTASGKPYLTNANGLHFGISHSGELVAVAISSAEVGLDIQIHEETKNLKMSVAEFSIREADIKRRGATLTQIKSPPQIPVHQTTICHNNHKYYLSVSTTITGVTIGQVCL